MIRPVSIASALLLIASSSVAVAEAAPKQNFSAQQLQQMCSATGDSDQAVAFNLICMGYIGGVMDMLTTTSALAQTKPLFCVPEGADRGQATAVFVAHMAAHPEKQIAVAASVIRTALIETWPCATTR